MQHKAVIFDLDGTLLDTLDDLADSFNAALSTFKFPMHPTSAYRLFVGDGAYSAVERSLPVNAREAKSVSAVLTRSVISPVMFENSLEH